MALRTLILACSLFVPAARPPDGDAVSARAHDVPSGKAPGMSATDGRSRPRAACCDDAFFSSPLLAEPDEDDEEFFEAPAAVLSRAAAGDPAVLRMSPAHSAPLSGRFPSGHIPLRC